MLSTGTAVTGTSGNAGGAETSAGLGVEVEAGAKAGVATAAGGLTCFERGAADGLALPDENQYAPAPARTRTAASALPPTTYLFGPVFFDFKLICGSTLAGAPSAGFQGDFLGEVLEAVWVSAGAGGILGGRRAEFGMSVTASGLVSGRERGVTTGGETGGGAGWSATTADDGKGASAGVCAGGTLAGDRVAAAAAVAVDVPQALQNFAPGV